MKKSYINPNCRIIDLFSENLIATSPDSLGIDETETIGSEDEMLTNKQNMWDREGIWK